MKHASSSCLTHAAFTKAFGRTRVHFVKGSFLRQSCADLLKVFRLTDNAQILIGNVLYEGTARGILSLPCRNVTVVMRWFT